jgi:hypothetical protein
MASLHPSATIARIDGRWPSLLPSCFKTGGENERLDAGAYRGSRCRLRHGISAVGPEIPYTKKRPLGPVPFTSRQTSSLWISGYSGNLLPPSPPAEKATARQQQARQASTGDGAGDYRCCPYTRSRLSKRFTPPVGYITTCNTHHGH